MPRVRGAVANAGTIMTRHTRHAYEIDLWPSIVRRIGKEGRVRDRWLFVALGLVILKLLESFRADGGRWIFMILPLIVAVMIFVVMRENPFRVSTKLRMEEQA